MWFIKCKAIYYLLEIAMNIRMGSSHQNVKQILLKLEKICQRIKLFMFRKQEGTEDEFVRNPDNI